MFSIIFDDDSAGKRAEKKYRLSRILNSLKNCGY